MTWNEGLEEKAHNITENPAKSLRVMAGPGTGKTFAIKRRTVRLLEEGTDPNKIFGVTFTRVIVLQTVISIAIAIALWRLEFEDQALGWALRLAMIITIIGAFNGGFMTRPTADQLAVLNPDALTMETLGVWAAVTAICARRSVTRVETIRTPELV
jgi:hypothetical protein